MVILFQGTQWKNIRVTMKTKQNKTNPNGICFREEQNHRAVEISEVHLAYLLRSKTITSPHSLSIKLIGSYISKYNHCLIACRWNINKVEDTDWFSNWEKYTTQVLHSVFKSFTDMTIVLASLILAHSHKQAPGHIPTQGHIGRDGILQAKL